jgi:hypothetical protein
MAITSKPPPFKNYENLWKLFAKLKNKILKIYMIFILLYSRMNEEECANQSEVVGWEIKFMVSVDFLFGELN